MRNLALEIDNGSGYQWAWLDEDASVTVENVNPIFDTEAGGTFTHAISLDVARNSHIFGAAADFRGPRIFNLLRKRKARLWIMGIPVTGIIQLDSQLSVEDGKVDIEIVSNSKELKDLLDGVNCRDVEISDDNIQLGYCFDDYLEIQQVITKKKSERQIYQHGWGALNVVYERDEIMRHNIALPKTLFTNWKGGKTQSGLIVSVAAKDFTNTQNPYNPSSPNAHPYCNVRVCYNKYQKNGDNWEKIRGYSVGEYDRINSAPCFYVGFWLHKLWEALGVVVEGNTLEQIADFNRIAFIHYDPQYNIDPDYGGYGIYNAMKKEERIENGLDVEVWLGFDDYEYRKQEGDKMCYYSYEVNGNPHASIYLHRAYANSKNFPDTDAQNVIDVMQGMFGARFLYNSSQSSLKVCLVRDILRQNTTLELPCVVTDANKTEPATLGFRLKYEGSSEATYNGITKVDNLTGANEQYDADTNYNYTDYTNVIFITETELPIGVVNENRSYNITHYLQLMANITNSDKTCYVSTTTGYAYRIKVDSDADSELTLYPSLFEVGTYQDWTEGDCSHEASTDGLIEEVSIPCTAAIPNDINSSKEIEAYTTYDSENQPQIFAYLIDGEIHNMDANDDQFTSLPSEYKDVVFLEDTVPVWSDKKNAYVDTKKAVMVTTVTLIMTGKETYDISNDGPYYASTHDSIMLGVMRGSGSDAELVYTSYNYDKENGESWYQTIGSDAEFTADSIDSYGNSFDYNGTAEGLGYDYNSDYNFPLSLKLRAEKENPGYSSYVKENADTLYSIYKIDSNHFKYNGYKYTKDGASVYLKNGTKVPNTRFFPINGTNAAGRGLGDRFYKEYAYWVLNRKILEMDVEASAAVLTGIDMTKRYRIGGVEGFIKQYSYSVDMKRGVSGAKIELYYI